MRVVRASATSILLGLVACGGTSAPPRTEPLVEAGTSPPLVSPRAGASAGADAAAPTAPATTSAPEIFARVRGDLASCYDEGRKAVPTMTSGRVTFHAAVDAAGKTTCVVPSDDTGLTQDVETCMRERLERETYTSSAAHWSAAIPIAVRDGRLELGEVRATPPAIETIESQGLSEDVYDVVESLLPELYACMQGLEKSSALRVVYVGGRVEKSGHVACALASSASALPLERRECLARVLTRARFRPPKKGWGLVSVPLNVWSRR